MSRLHLFGPYYLGTGLITVVGTSFATLSTATAVNNDCLFLPVLVLIPYRFSIRCTIMVHVHQLRLLMGQSLAILVLMHMEWFSVRIFRRFVIWFLILCTGTSLICSFLEMGMSFCSPKLLKRIFPPLVTGEVDLFVKKLFSRYWSFFDSYRNCYSYDWCISHWHLRCCGLGWRLE